jgi:hypothetical protein
MKKNVFVVRVCSAPNILISGQIIKEMPGSVASGTHCIIENGMISESTVACMGEMRGVYRVLVGKAEGKIPLGRPRCRWEDNIKMDLQEVGMWGVWSGSNWLRVGTGGGHL